MGYLSCELYDLLVEHGMHDHVLNSEVKYLVDLGLVSKEVEVPPVQFLGEEDVVLIEAGLLDELSIR